MEARFENGPFECQAEFIGIDNKPQVVYLLMIVKSAPWGVSRRSGRAGCCVTAESFEGGIIGDSRSTFLNVHEVELDIGPSLEGFREPEQDLRESRVRGISTSDQWPQMSDWISKWSRTRESGVDVGIALPKSISLNGSHSRGKSFTFQAETVGLDVNKITIDRWKSNHFLWRYPIAYPGEPFAQGPLDHSAKFSHHRGSITYFQDQPPASVNLDFTITYRLPGHKPAIQYHGKDYPCRSFRFKLRAKILPNQDGEFIYPREDSNGIYLDLGTFKCTHDPDGHAVLQVLHEDYKIPIRDPHLGNQLIDQSHGANWKIRQLGKGRYDVNKSGVHEGIVSADGNIDATLGDWSEPKKLKRRRN
jgi:hypothetical protein